MCICLQKHLACAVNGSLSWVCSCNAKYSLCQGLKVRVQSSRLMCIYIIVVLEPGFQVCLQHEHLLYVVEWVHLHQG